MAGNGFVKSKEAAEILNMTTRRVVGLCNEGKFEGAYQKGRGWLIPEDSVLSYQDVVFEKKAEYGRLPCAVGNTSYVEIAQSCYYVDKTLLIKELIDDQVPVTLFTRPRRFGKTLTMDMIKTFFEKSDEDTSTYFRDKQIWRCGEKYRSRQGKYPVISITFKDVKYNSWNDCLEMIKIILRDEYMRHAELVDSSSINSVEQNYLVRMMAGSLSDVEYSRALLNLSRMLEKHHQKKVVILIDEYDTPIQQGHARGFYQEVISFMRNFMSGGLKDNRSLSFGVMTGILRVSKENLFSGLNNLVVNTVLDQKYSQYFGFTLKEVEKMASYYGKRNKLDEIGTWYDGYRFGDTEIYNPWSVTNYFYNNCIPKPYWTNTSDNEIIREIMRSLSPEIAEGLFSLMKGDAIQASLNMEVIYPTITDDVDTIFSFLLMSGYLKPVCPAVETEFGTFIELALPNTEVQRVYNTEILSWLRSSLNGNVMSALEKALFMNDGNALKETLQKYMISCISCFDGASEGFYHGMMLGLLAGLSSKYYIRSNREAGKGRFDLLLEPKTRNMPGIIMEFKATSDADKLAVCANTALKQIQDKAYDTDLKERGITDIAKYGIAFSGKSVEIVM